MQLNSYETVSTIFIKIYTPDMMYVFYGAVKCFIYYYNLQYLLDVTPFKEVSTQNDIKLLYFQQPIQSYFHF